MEIREIQHGQLTLTNDGELSLFFIGAGSAFTKKNYQNNIIVVKGKDHLLIDCGTLCSTSLYETGLPLTALRNIYLTHIHADHTGGMEEVFLMNRYITKQRPTLIIDESFQDLLWNQALRGGSGYSEKIKGRFLELEDFVDVKRPTLLKKMDFRETWEINVGKLNFKFPRTRHIPDSAATWKDAMPSYAVIIDERIMFTSDTMFDRELIETYDDLYHFECIFHDCQLYPGGVHASLEEIKEFPADLKSRMVLMHYGDNWKDFEDKALIYGFKTWAKTHHLYSFSKK